MIPPPWFFSDPVFSAAPTYAPAHQGSSPAGRWRGSGLLGLRLHFVDRTRIRTQPPSINGFDVEAPVATDSESRQLGSLQHPVDRALMNVEVIGHFFYRQNSFRHLLLSFARHLPLVMSSNN